MTLWIAILIAITINIIIVLHSSKDLVNKAYNRGFTDGIDCIIKKEYVRLDQIIKND